MSWLFFAAVVGIVVLLVLAEAGRKGVDRNRRVGRFYR